MAPERKNPQRLFIKVIRENEKKGAPGERKKDALERIMRKIRPLEGELTLIDEIADGEMSRDRLRSDLLAQCLRDFERTQCQMKQIEVLRPMLEGFFSEISLEQTGKPVGELKDYEFYSLVARFVSGKGVEREPRE